MRFPPVAGLLLCLGLTGCPGVFSSDPVDPTADVLTPRATPGPSPPAVSPPPQPEPTTATPAADEAGATRPFAFSAPPVPAGPARCDFGGLSLPAGTRIYAAGAYSGRKLSIQIDDSGHEATSMEVAVNHPQAPVVLMLGAYEPSVWQVGWSPGTRIVAVLLSGYHHQVITGLPAEVPVLTSTHENRGGCGYFHVDAARAEQLNPVARKVFGQPVDMLYPATSGKVVIGNPLAPGVALVTAASAASVESFRVPDSQLAGPAGLAHAVSEGLLRPARLSDLDDWESARDKLQRPVDVPPVAGGQPPRSRHLPHNSYVVLQKFQLPAGLYGAHSATFFVPRGISRPTGNPGHSTIYDLNSGSCTGPVCRTD